MKDQFCNYEISLKLKELGFDDWCFCFYNDSKKLLYFTGYDVCTYQLLEDMIFTYGEEDLKAPLLQQAIWFLNKKLLKLGYEGYNDVYLRTDGVLDKKLNMDILKAIELITPKQ